jgi:hypothetical protein
MLHQKIGAESPTSIGPQLFRPINPSMATQIELACKNNHSLAEIIKQFSSNDFYYTPTHHLCTNEGLPLGVESTRKESFLKLKDSVPESHYSWMRKLQLISNQISHNLGGLHEFVLFINGYAFRFPQGFFHGHVEPQLLSTDIVFNFISPNKDLRINGYSEARGQLTTPDSMLALFSLHHEISQQFNYDIGPYGYDFVTIQAQITQYEHPRVIALKMDKVHQSVIDRWVFYLSGIDQQTESLAQILPKQHIYIIEFNNKRYKVPLGLAYAPVTLSVFLKNKGIHRNIQHTLRLPDDSLTPIVFPDNLIRVSLPTDSVITREQVMTNISTLQKLALGYKKFQNSIIQRYGNHDALPNPANKYLEFEGMIYEVPISVYFDSSIVTKTRQIHAVLDTYEYCMSVIKRCKKPVIALDIRSTGSTWWYHLLAHRLQLGLLKESTEEYTYCISNQWTDCLTVPSESDNNDVLYNQTIILLVQKPILRSRRSSPRSNTTRRGGG